jgi:hypothetical protein
MGQGHFGFVPGIGCFFRSPIPKRRTEAMRRDVSPLHPFQQNKQRHVAQGLSLLSATEHKLTHPDLLHSLQEG